MTNLDQSVTCEILEVTSGTKTNKQSGEMYQEVTVVGWQSKPTKWKDKLQQAPVFMKLSKEKTADTGFVAELTKLKGKLCKVPVFENAWRDNSGRSTLYITGIPELAK